MAADAAPQPDGGQPRKKAYLSQADVPRYTLEDALVVPTTIAREYAKEPTRPLDIAIAMGHKPESGTFRQLCGAALAYGLTDGGPRVARVGLTDLGKRIVAPTVEGDDVAAKRQALMQPRVPREFLSKYNGSRLPTRHIALNVLEDLGVPADRVAPTFEFIVEGARSVGMLREVKGDLYVDLDAADTATSAHSEPEDDGHGDPSVADVVELPGSSTTPNRTAPTPSPLTENRKVFMARGKKKQKLIEQVKELLRFGDFDPVIAEERETVSKPVPDKVMDHMRACGAAVIHVDTELKVMDQEGNEHRMLNPNVLIEIGAALALYGRKFILLVEDGTELPSNLQGLYEVRYSGDELDHTATMKLLKAFNDFKDAEAA